MKQLTITILLFCSFFSGLVFAENSNNCLETAITQAELNQCAGVTYQQADSELNRVYKRVQILYKDDKLFLQKLKKAQQDWIRSRDADFEMMYPYHDEQGYYGSSFSMCASGYRTKLTLERVAYLKKWLKGVEEGDVCSGSPMYEHNIQDLIKK